MLRALATTFILAMAVTLAWAGKQFMMPAIQPAKAYPAHDYHPSETATVAADPYDTPEKERIFGVHYREIGMMPVLLVITNDGDRTISLAGMKAELVTGNRSKLSPAVPDDIYRRISHPRRGTSYPLPFPTKKVKGGINTQTRDEVENSQFSAKAVEPHSTQAGFLFFDVEGIPSPLAGSHLYLTGVRNAQGNELMYFEIPLDKYLNASPKP